MAALEIDPGQDAVETDPRDEDVAEPAVEDQDDDAARVIYIGYKPSKVREGHSHPDPIVETQALGAVVPPDPHYQHNLQDLVDLGHISDAQLETIIYACMRFEQRLDCTTEQEQDEQQQPQEKAGAAGAAADAIGGSGGGAPRTGGGGQAREPPRPRAGFFLGDGAGVGKGRQIGALVRECWQRKLRRVLWISVSTDLREDAARDLRDTGCMGLTPPVELYPAGRQCAMPAASDSLERHLSQGVLFVTYSLLIGKGSGVVAGNAAVRQRREEDNERSRARMEREFRRDPMQFYPHGSRLRQIVDWLQAGGEGRGECLIVLDECHRAKNLLLGPEGTQTGRAVEALQLALPNARVLYSSATGATEPQNLAYMLRLGHKGFESMRDLSTSLQAAGLGALELFASGMKALGTYVGRTLSYGGAEFMVEQAEIQPEYRVMYDRAAELWQLLFKITENLPSFGDKRDSLRFSQFWSSHQRFFRLMLIACKVNRCAQLAREAVRRGHAVVIGLQSTGEANMEQVRTVEGDELEDFISSPQVQIRNFVMRFFPTRHPATIEVDTMALDRLVFQVKAALDAWGPLVPAAEEVVRNAAYWGADIGVDAARDMAVAASRAAGNGTADTPAGAVGLATPAPRQRGTAGGAVTSAAGRNVAVAAAAVPMATAATDSDDDILEVTEVPASAAKTPSTAAAQRRRRQPLQERQALAATAAVKAEPAVAAAAALGRPGRPLKADPGDKGVGGRRARALRDGSAFPDEPIVIDDSNSDRDCGAAEAAKARAAKASTATAAAGEGDDVGEKVLVAAEVRLVQERHAALRRGDLMDLSSSRDDEAVLRLATQLRAEEAAERDAARAGEMERARAELAAREQELKKALQRLQLLEDGEADPASTGHGARGESTAADADAGQPDAKRRCIQRSATGAGAAAATGSSACGVCGGHGSSSLSCSNPMLICCVASCRARLHLRCWDETAVERPMGDWWCPDCVARRSQRRYVGASDFQRNVALARCRSEMTAAEAGVTEAQRALQRLSLGEPQSQQQRQQQQLEQRRSGGEGQGAGGRGGGGGNRADAIVVDEDDFSLDAVLAAASTPAAAARVKKEAAVVNGTANGKAPKRRGRPIKREREADMGADRAGGASGGCVAQTPGGGGGSSYAVRSRALPLGMTEKMIQEDTEAADGGGDDEDVFIPQLATIRKLLFEFVGRALELPPTPLDQLVHLLGGAENVAELTGRKGRLEAVEDGKIRYQDRSQQLGEARKRVNLKEKKTFMDGLKHIAIISDAASTGVSLHASRTVPNQRRRFHITLELPWSADKAIQQFGRSHRANQASAPIYCLLVSKCGGEYRFAGSVARRLQSLGALLQGDRNALGATKDLKAFDVTSPWGKAAVHQLYFECKNPNEPGMPGVVTPLLPLHLRAGPMGAVVAARAVAEQQAAVASGGDGREVDVPEPERRSYFIPYLKNCLKNVGLAKAIHKVNPRNPTLVDHSAAGEKRVESFLNRLLGLPLADQQRVFDYFWQLTSLIVAHAKSWGLYDYGIQGLEGRSLTVRSLRTVHTEPYSDAKAFYAEVEADRGLPWPEALAAYEEALQLCGAHRRPDPRIGFYVDKTGRTQGGTGQPLVLLATPCASERITRRVITWFRIRRPNGAGRRGNKLVDSDLHFTYAKIPMQRAQQLWEFWYQFLKTHCIHGHNCSRRQQGESCGTGQSIVKHHIVSGAVIPIWRQLSEVIAGVRQSRRSSLEGEQAAAIEEGEQQQKQAAQRGGRRRVQDAEGVGEDDGGLGDGQEPAEGGGRKGRVGGKRHYQRWPACVRVQARASPHVAAQAQQAGMRLAPPQPLQQQPAAVVAAEAAGAGPSSGGAASAQHVNLQQQQLELLFVGLDLKVGQVKQLLSRLEQDRREAEAAAQPQIGQTGGGSAAAAGRGGAYG